MAILIVVIYQLLLIIGRYSATRCHGGGRGRVFVDMPGAGAPRHPPFECYEGVASLQLAGWYSYFSFWLAGFF